MRKLREMFRSHSVNADFCDECAAVLTSGRCLDQQIEAAKVKVLRQMGRISL